MEQKIQKTKGLQPRRATILLSVSILLIVFFIGFTSALEFDNTKSKIDVREGVALTIGDKVVDYNPLWVKYPPMKIDNLFGLGSTLFEGAIVEHTETCGTDCSSVIAINHKGGILIEDVRFYTVTDEDTFLQPIRSYQFYYNVGDYEVEDYARYCNTSKKDINGKMIFDCWNELTGTHTEKNWTEFSLEQVFDAGTYEIKLVGEKRPDRVVDWQIKSNGIWTTDWAVWGGTASTLEHISLGGGTSVSSYSERMGVYINITNPAGIDVVGVARMPTSICNQFYIDNATIGNTYCSAGTEAQSGNNFTMTSCHLNYNNQYYVVCRQAGAPAILRGINETGVSFPITTTNIVWLEGRDNAGSSTAIWDIAGLFVGGGSSATVTLNSPADASAQSNLVTTNATATISGGATIVNATLWDNSTGSWGARNITTGLSGGTQTITNTNTYADGLYKWNYNFCDSDGNCSVFYNANRTFSVDNSAPVITINSGSGAFGYKPSYHTINFTATDTALDKCYIRYGNFSSTNNYNTSLNTLVYNRTCTIGSYLHRVTIPETCRIGGVFNISTNTYTTMIGAIYRNYNCTNSTGNYKITNEAIPDPSSADCNDTFTAENNITCSSGIAKTYTFNITSDSTATLFANDTLGNLNSTIINFNYKITENSQTYSTPVSEASSSLFAINFTLSGATVSGINLIYNGTSNPASFVEGGSTVYASLNHSAPSVTTDTNLTFYWNITLNDSITYSSSSLTQLVQDIGIDNCSVYTYPIFNFTLLDEDTQTLINSSDPAILTSIKVDLSIKNPTTGVVLFNYSNVGTDVNPFAVCFKNNIGSSIYTLDGVIEYSSTDRFVEFYHIQSYNLTNSTISQNISLYDLNSSKGQAYKITFKNANYNTVSGALIQLQRKYISEGVFKTIEIPRTSSAGYTIGHLITNDIIYNIIVLKDGVVLGSFENIVANCQNPAFTECEININAYSDAISPIDFSTDGDLTSTLTYNSTSRVLSSTFVVLSGIPTTTTLNATLFNSYGNTTICSDALYSSGGTLGCTVPTSFGNTTMQVKLYSGGVLKKSGTFSLMTPPSQMYGGNLVFIGLMIILLIVGISIVDNPVISVAIMIFGIILLTMLNIISSAGIMGVGATIIWFIIAMIVILVKGSRR